MNQMTPPSTENSWRPLALGMAIAGVALTVMFRMMPYDFRLPNLAPIGALCLFVGARLTLWQAFLLPLAAMGLSDIALYTLHGWKPSYVSYACYAISILLGRALLRRTESPISIGATTFAGSVQFFFITNFAAWLENPRLYTQDFAGLLASYEAALPFYRGTLIGDVVFSGVLFGAYAWLARTYFPAERVVPATVEEVRS